MVIHFKYNYFICCQLIFSIFSCNLYSLRPLTNMINCIIHKLFKVTFKAFLLYKSYRSANKSIIYILRISSNIYNCRVGLPKCKLTPHLISFTVTEVYIKQKYICTVFLIIIQQFLSRMISDDRICFISHSTFIKNVYYPFIILIHKINVIITYCNFYHYDFSAYNIFLN